MINFVSSTIFVFEFTEWTLCRVESTSDRILLFAAGLSRTRDAPIKTNSCRISIMQNWEEKNAIFMDYQNKYIDKWM